MSPVPLISLEHVGRSFDDGRIVALRDVDLDIFAGDTAAILGASGSGKTTLISLMCGIMAPSEGVIRWRGKPVASARAWTDLRRSAIGIVFQDFNLFPTLTSAENVEVAMFGSPLSGAARKKKVAEALAAVGLSHRAGHLPHEMSGGERQRVAIARSIINAPELLLADEPTGNLDSVSAAATMDLLLSLCRDRGLTLVLVTHDPAYANHCARHIHVKDGEVSEAAVKVAEVTA